MRKTRRRDERPAASEEAHLSGELAGSERGDQVFPHETGPDQVELPAEHGVEVEVLVALVKDLLSGAEGAPRTERSDASELLLGQPGE